MASPDHLNRRELLASVGLLALSGKSLGQGAPEDIRPSNRFDFDEIYPRLGTACAKWDGQVERFGPDSLVAAMGVADMDFRTAPPITAALRKRLEHENWGYMRVPESFYESVMAWNQRRYGEDIKRDQILRAPGVLPGLRSAIRAFCPPGSHVLLLSPGYTGFYDAIAQAGCLAKQCPLTKRDGAYAIDFDAFERSIDADTKAFILCNPHNPTGNCWSVDELRTLGEICLQRGLVLLADEIHCDFVTKGHRYTPFASLPDESSVRNAITFKSVSKAFNLSALKCGYLYSRNPENLSKIMDSGHSEDVNSLGIIAAQVAYEEGGEWLDQLVHYIDGNMALVEQFVSEHVPLVKFRKPQGTYLAWLDCSQLSERIGAEQAALLANQDPQPESEPVRPDDIVELFLVEHAGVKLNRGYRYGEGGPGHMRMNLGTSRRLIQTSLERIAAATSAA